MIPIMLAALIFMGLMQSISPSLLFGVVTKDAAIISSTNAFEKNGVTMRGDYDWIRQLGEECLVGIQGDSSDCDFLFTKLESFNGEHLLRYGRSLPSKSIAHLCRRIIAQYLRSNQLKVSVLIAGWNRDENRPSLHWLDSIGAIQVVPYAAHGQEFSFVLGLLDRKNRDNNYAATGGFSTATEIIAGEEGTIEIGSSVSDSDVSSVQHIPMQSENQITTSLLNKKRTGALLQMDVTGGVSVIKSCIEAARKRTVGRLGSFGIKCVTASGCRDLGSG